MPNEIGTPATTNGAKFLISLAQRHQAHRPEHIGAYE